MYLSPLRRPLTWPFTWPFTAPDDVIMGAFRSILASQKFNLKIYYSSPAPQWNQLQISETKHGSYHKSSSFLPSICFVRKKKKKSTWSPPGKILAWINRSYDALSLSLAMKNEWMFKAGTKMFWKVFLLLIRCYRASNRSRERETSGWNTQNCWTEALDFDLPPPLMVVRQIKTSNSNYFLMQGQTGYVVVFISVL